MINAPTRFDNGLQHSFQWLHFFIFMPFSQYRLCAVNVWYVRARSAACGCTVVRSPSYCTQSWVVCVVFEFENISKSSTKEDVGVITLPLISSPHPSFTCRLQPEPSQNLIYGGIQRIKHLAAATKIQRSGFFGRRHLRGLKIFRITSHESFAVTSATPLIVTTI